MSPKAGVNRGRRPPVDAYDLRRRLVRIQPQVRQAIEQRVDRPCHFHTREMLSETNMGSGRECKVTVPLAEKIELVRIRVMTGIAIRGPVRDFAGLQMKGGTLVLMSGAEQRTGAWMQRGTIISLKPLKLMPTFAEACLYTPSFLGVYAKHLSAFGFSLPLNTTGGYRRHIGDCSVPGKGEILVWHPNTNA